MHQLAAALVLFLGWQEPIPNPFLPNEPQTDTRYGQLDVPANLQEILAERLEMFKSRKDGISPQLQLLDAFKQFDLSKDPELARWVRQFQKMKLNNNFGQLSAEDEKKFFEMFKNTDAYKRSVMPLQKTLEDAWKNLKFDAKPMPMPALEPPQPFELPEEDPITKSLKTFLEDADASEFGRKYLHDAPAWQSMLSELKRGGFGDKNAWLGKDLSRWLPSRSRHWDFDWRPKNVNVDLTGLKSHLPGLPNVHMSIPRLGLPSFGGFSAPSTPSFPGGSSGDGDLRPLIWFLLAVMVGTVIWLWRKNQTKKTVIRSRRLGDWPVAPEQVSTRRQLIEAFDYLALFVLGDEAIAWNHRRVANGLGGADEQRRQAAQRLAKCYETARYTEGADPLPEPQCQTVRHDLRLLASSH